MMRHFIKAGCSWYKLSKKGGVFLTVRDSDKNEIANTAKKFERLGFKLYATEGTSEVA